ncbi:MAG TPA: hypothetical protein PKA82_12865 [Pyrinomonadaceae bacterium]|nr:hypothetical protein [Pyrinomonadaceae bacterium]
MFKKGRILHSLASVIFVFVSSASVSAYDNDTHYWLTYYLAVKAGYTPLQAEQIASANVSVDFDDDTEPVTPDLNSILGAYRYKAVFSVVRSKYHALPSKSDINAITNPKVIYWWDPQRPKDAATLSAMEYLVTKRKKEFWAETILAKQNPGMFLHFLQDTFAHRDFASFFGHAGYRRIDHLSSDRVKAKSMALSTLQYLIAFRLSSASKVQQERWQDPEELKITEYLSPGQMSDIESVVGVFCDVNPSIGVEESAIVKKWPSLEEDSKTDFSTPSGYLLPAMYEAYKENTAPDSRRAREVVISSLRLKVVGVPEIWLYDYSQAGVAKRRTSFARVYEKYQTPIASTHDYPAKNESENTKRKRMRKISGKKRKLCMPYELVSDATKMVAPCD